MEELKRDLSDLRAESVELAEQIALYEHNNRHAAFRLEQLRAPRMSIWWYILVVASTVCTLGTAASSSNSGSYITLFLNWIAFLITWRLLYFTGTASTRMGSMLFTALIVAYTIKFT
jgi:hypothetical protein